ncbi:MAG: glycosyltransferase family 1 protein [Hydrogenibacillus sp.]|nr:glycosyltransferase family 1 protein [Hydrogenibacillus sp.]
MRIALFTDTFPPEINGVALTLKRFTDFLRGRDIPVLVVAPEYPKASHGPFDRMVERSLSVPFWLYPEVRLAVPRPFYLKQKLDDFRPTLCHLATPANLGLYGRTYCRKRQIPMVASYHTHLDRYLSYYNLAWMLPMLHEYMKWFHRAAERIYAPSEETRAHLRALGMNNVELFPRGVDTTLFYPRPPEKRREIRARYDVRDTDTLFVYVGRLAKEKDLDVLADAIWALDPDVLKISRFLFVGDGPMAGELKARLSGAPVQFLGFLQGEALADVYSAADWFVFPSTTETFGNVVLEALASGTPVIAAAAGGVAHLVQDGKNGIAVPGGEASAFKTAIERACRAPKMRPPLAAGALSSAQGKSWEAVFERLVASYREVLEETGAVLSGVR